MSKGYLLSYASGVIGYGLPDDLDAALLEAARRCTELNTKADVIERDTYKAVASVVWRNGSYLALPLRRWRIEFNGREAGALGVTYPIVKEVDAPDEAAATPEALRYPRAHHGIEY